MYILWSLCRVVISVLETQDKWGGNDRLSLTYLQTTVDSRKNIKPPSLLEDNII
jgi:hypothetical protein